MSDFQNFWDSIYEEIIQLAKNIFKENWQAAVKDGKTFAEKTKEDLERWTKLLAKGELTQDDFIWLVKGKKDLAEMEMLKQLGLTLVSIDKFRNGLIEIIINTAFKVFL